MKKIILALAATSVLALADTATIDATMKLMKQGLEQAQSGFVYNDKKDLMRGIETLESSNSIFKNVDVSVFIPNNNKVQVTRNINKNLEKNLKALKKSVKNEKYSEATKHYAEVVNNCISCHTIIRGW